MTSQVVLSLPPDPQTGEVQYCVHWQRELRSNWKTLWVLLTGKDTNGQQVEGLEPTLWWKQIIDLTRTAKRPNGIVGSQKLLSRKACPCLAGACISQCSCPHCTTFLENLDHRHLAVNCGWRAQANADPCTECAGECHDPTGIWMSMSGGLLPFLRKMLCPPVPVPGVFVNAVDPRTGFEKPDERKPVMMIPRDCWLGKCSKCGWHNRFSKFPLLSLKIKEDENTEREVTVRACPREARLDKTTTFHQFIKMERGESETGALYTQPEWTPSVVNRREFYYRLTTFMEDFLPHYYLVKWHDAFDKVFFQQYKRLAFVGLDGHPQPPESMKGQC